MFTPRTKLALVNINRGGTFDSAADGTFQSDTGGTFDSDIPGTFESDIDGTFKVMLSVDSYLCSINDELLDVVMYMENIFV